MAALKASLPSGRIRRAAKVGGLVGGQAARSYATRAANLTRSEQGRKAANANRRIESAEHIVEVLGEMKGGAMKLGQLASFIDVGGLSGSAGEGFQAKLASLRDSAPPVPFKEMRKVIEQDLDDRIPDLFAEFDPDAVAAASVGQVYRARLHDGRAVAVKVQYPRVAAAVRADLQNLGLILRAMRGFAPGLNASAVASEVRERTLEELDYEHEAQAQRSFARRWRGHPFIVVPDVVTELSRERVLVSEWVDGVGFEQVLKLDQGERNRFAEIVFRFFFGSLYRFGQFSGDPQPGNYLLLADGRVAFIDFGMTKHVGLDRVDAELDILRAGLEGNAIAVHDGLAGLGFFDAHDPRFDPERLLAQVCSLNGWYASDEDFTITQEYISKVMIDAGDPRSEYWDMMKHETVPQDSLFANRMQGMTLSVLAHLGAKANWHRIMSEWLYRSSPASPLGEADAEFFGRMPAQLLGAA
jgi:predicted unusual protein kinase regulating ubiquinone biosynthesis (AarF/ABC1/UbiB family)